MRRDGSADFALANLSENFQTTKPQLRSEVAIPKLQILSRITSTGRYIPEVDGMRTIAIGAVFLQHLQQQLVAVSHSTAPLDLGTKIIANSRLGIELFFVISGFILGAPFASAALSNGRPIRLGAYYLRRLTRLEPPYIVHLLLTAAVLVLLGRRQGIVLHHMLASALYVNNLTFGQWHPDTLNTVTWSLEIEVQFYLLAPLLALVFRVRSPLLRRSSILLAALLSFALGHLLERRFGELPPTLLGFLPFFAVGFLVADIYVASWNEELPRSSLWDPVALILWVSLPALSFVTVPASSLVLAVGLFFAVMASLRADFIRRMLASFWVRTIGGWCYSFYLLHLLLLRVFVPWLGLPIGGTTAWDIIKASLVYGPMVLTVTCVYFLLVEKPCMRKDWWRPLVPRAAAQTFSRLFIKGAIHGNKQ